MAGTKSNSNLFIILLLIVVIALVGYFVYMEQEKEILEVEFPNGESFSVTE